jgi:hypothetical protein
MNKILCPECHSDNIRFFESRNRYICINCGCGFYDQDQEAKKLRIFLSYGHDANEELVLLIKTDLEKRGHDVWFDKNEIKFGDEWRRSITDGIIDSNRVLSFLSKHSTRDPGVCRDEIAIAIGVKGGNIQTILVESEQEVQPPVNIGHIQWLDMHEWHEKRMSGTTEWKNWYQYKLSEIVRVLESEESRRFAGEIDKLNEYLKPIKSDARVSGLLNKCFYGREWLFNAVENWRRDTTQNSRLFWIMGDPGVGKSAFAAQLTHKHGDIVIAAQFCEWDKPDHRDARRVVCSIAFQLATRLPDYRKLLLTLNEISDLDRKGPSELFDYLLSNPLRSSIHGGRERYLIIIDALDEAGEAGRNPLVEMLAYNAQHLPVWLGLVITSRPENDVRSPLQGLKPFVLDACSSDNRDDLRGYLHIQLVVQLGDRSHADHLIEQILEKSEGVFLYVERFCEAVSQSHLSLDHPEEFPQGLGGIYYQWFQRQFPDLEVFHRDIRPGLRCIIASREPLPLDILCRLFNWQQEQAIDFACALGSLFPILKEANKNVIKAYHRSLTDWLEDVTKADKYYVSSYEGHRIMADQCWDEYYRGADSMSEFFVRYGLYHLRQADRENDASNLTANAEFMKRRMNLGLRTIFLSYSRQQGIETAKRIRYDLVNYGHAVLEDYAPGGSWVQAATENIRAADIVVYLITHDSETYIGENCGLDEVAYARNEGKPIIPLLLDRCASIPLLVYNIQFVDFSQDYSVGLKLLLSGLQSGITKYRSFQEKLQSWDFMPFLKERRHGFVGRDWLFTEVQKWIEGAHSESCLLIAGDPGIGKSAFVGQWVHLNPDDKLLAYHCCQINSPYTIQPHCFVRSVAAMIANQLPEYEELLQNTRDSSVADALKEDACRNDPVRGFEVGIIAPLQHISKPAGSVRYIMIDALDDAVLIKQSPSIVDLLAYCLDRLPHWLRLVCTTRKDPAVFKKLEGLSTKHLHAQDQRNIADTITYLSSRFQSEPLAKLAQETKLTLPKMIDLLLDSSKGNFLYLHYALDGLTLGSYHLDRPDEVPPGMKSFYENAFMHRFSTEEEYKPVSRMLAVLLDTSGPVDFDLLQKRAGFRSRREIVSLLQKLAVFLCEHNGAYSLFHPSLARWLTDIHGNPYFCIQPNHRG